MKLIDTIKTWFAPRAAESVDSSKIIKGTELFELLTGGISSAGVVVNEQTAMRVSAVYACVNLIGGAISSMPLPIYMRTTDGRARVGHDLYWLLNEQAHPNWSAAVMWEYLVSSLLLVGDAFAWIHRRGRYVNDIESIEPLPKSRVTVTRKGNELLYIYQPEDGGVIAIDQADMLHIPGSGFDGLNGMSQVKHALRNSAGIAIAADDYSARFFKNGARPDFAIELPGNITKEQQDMLRRTWSERHGGLDNAHLPALLVGGAKVHELTMNAEDAQLIDTRKFQIEDIARVFGVPPHMIGHTDKTTSWGSGVEQMSIGFVKYTLQRHLVKIEQELNRKIWPNREKYYVEFNTAGLERGDYKTRNEGYRIALGRAGEPAWMTVNEVRKLENLPPVDGGDEMQQPQPDASKPDPQAMAAMRALDVAALAVNKEQPAPVIHNHVAAPITNIAPTEVHNHLPQTEVQVAAPEVVVQNEVNVPETNITVEAVMPEQPVPQVTVNHAPSIVNVAPATIQDVNIKSMPDRTVSSDVAYDKQGNIVSTTQTERDA